MPQRSRSDDGEPAGSLESAPRWPGGAYNYNRLLAKFGFQQMVHSSFPERVVNTQAGGTQRRPVMNMNPADFAVMRTTF